jgi:hypothetical protein
MAYTVFDGVAKFTADSSQLDQFIVTLEQGLTSASEKAAASTRDLKSAQDDFRAAIQAVSAEGGNTTANLQVLAEAEKNLALAAAAAKVEHAALKQSLTDTAQASSITSDAAEELTAKFTSMFSLLAAAEGFKQLITGTQQSVLQLQLLSEKTGIAISTLAGIQHVSEASGVSFDSVSSALTRLSKAQAQAIEGGSQQVAAFQRIGISVNELKTLSPEDLFYRVATAMASSSSHAAENATAFTLLGKGGSALIPIFQQNGDAIRGMVEEAAKASGVTEEAGLAALDWEKQTANLSEAFRSGLIPLMQAAVPAIKALETAGYSVALVIHDLAAAIGGLFFTAIAEAKAAGTTLDDAIHGNFSKMVSDAKASALEITQNQKGMLQQFQDNWANATKSIQQVWTDVKPLKQAGDDLSDLTENSKKLMEQQVEIAKGALDQQLAQIDKWKAGVHAAYASGQVDAADWQVAELRAVDASNIAHEGYLQKLVSIYQKAGDAAKAQSTQEQLIALQTKDQATATDDLSKAEEKHRQEVTKVTSEYQKLLDAGIAKDFKDTQAAAEQLTKSEEDLTKAQGKLNDTLATKNYAAQEEAIKQLAQIGLITEEQKAQKLRALYQQEEDDAVAALRQTQQKVAVEGAKGNALFGPQQLADLQTNLKSAEGDFDKSIAVIKNAFASVEKANPFLTPAQLDELQAQLNKVLAAFTTTQTEITSTEDKYEKERTANQKGALGDAIEMAMAAGNQLLAQDLKQHQSALIAIKDQIALAQARGLDVTAMKAQEKELQNSTNALVKQAGEMNTLRQAWDLFSADFKKKAQDNDSDAQEMAASFQTAAQGLEQGVSAAFAAMITGSESAGQAIEQAAFQTIGKIAEQWGAYYLARAIADTFDNPAAAGAEYAAGIALEALGGILSGLGSSKSTSSAGATTPNLGATPSTSTTTAETAGAQPVQVQNVQHFAAGGLASVPTLAVIGDSEHGGAASEAVIPLENRSALNAIADALVPALLVAMLRAQGVQASSDASPDFSASRFFDGGLITGGPLLAMLGDSQSGAAAEEAVLPLENDSTMARIAASIVSQFRFPANAQPRYESGATSSLLSNSTLAAATSAIERSFSVQSSQEYGAGAIKSTDVQAIATAFAKALNEKTPMGGTINIQLESDVPQLVKKINHGVNTGRLRLKASDSIRHTRRS